MTRFDLTKLLAPTALAPRLTGPRDTGTAPDRPATHTLPNFFARAATTPRAAPISSPTPRVQKGPPAMPASPNQDAVLAALEKHSPMDRAALLKATKLTATALDQTIFILNKQKRIVKGGTQADRQYGLPGTKFSAFDLPPKPAKQPKPAKKPRSTGTFSAFSTVTPLTKRHDELMPAARPQPVSRDGIFDVTALPCRAMKLANGGAIVLQGDLLVTELTAAQLDVVRQL